MQESVKELGEVSREDVARVLVECLQRTPAHSLIFSLESGRPAEPVDLGTALAGLQESVPANMQR